MKTSLAFFPERKKFNISWIINKLSRFHVSIALLDNRKIKIHVYAKRQTSE